MLPFCPDDADDHYISKIISTVEESRQLAKQQIVEAEDKNHRSSDFKHRIVSYASRELLWVYIPLRPVGFSRKLLRKYFDPYQLLRSSSDVTYKL